MRTLVQQYYTMKASEHFKNYVTELIDGLVSVDAKQIDSVTEELISAYSNGNNIFVCGNGGSAAIADHFCCDHSKGVHTDTDMLPQIQPLTGNVSTLTAIANDMGYEHVFSYQLKLKAKAHDLLIVISSSGNSSNIVNAIIEARRLGVVVIALVGFDGGYASKNSHMTLHVKSDNYGVVEDSHQALMHIMAQSIRLTHLNKESIKL